MTEGSLEHLGVLVVVCVSMCNYVMDKNVRYVM